MTGVQTCALPIYRSVTEGSQVPFNTRVQPPSAEEVCDRAATSNTAENQWPSDRREPLAAVLFGL